MYNIHSEELMNKSQVIEAFKKSAKNTKYVRYDEKNEVLRTKRTEIYVNYPIGKLSIVSNDLSCTFTLNFRNIDRMLVRDDTIYFYGKDSQVIAFVN
jgi:hypothetical protein